MAVDTIYGPWRTYRDDHPHVSDADIASVLDGAADAIQRQGFHPSSIECYDGFSADRKRRGPLCATAAINVAARKYQLLGAVNPTIGALERFTGEYVANWWSDRQTAESVVQTFRTLAAEFND